MERLRTHKFNKLQSGKADTLDELFEQIIKPQFANREAVIALHKAIMSYVEREDAVFFLRLYGSYNKDSYELLRRGFLTEYPDKSRMVFCDNTFSMAFAGVKLSGIDITDDQIAEYLNKKNLICSFGLTSKEKELSYYTQQKAIRVSLNSKGYYQAHIKPTGYDFDGTNVSLKDVFPNPERGEWGVECIRKAANDLTLEEKMLLKAHFVRLIHPLNSFLVPKRDHFIYSGKNIGEEVELIKYVEEYLKKEFEKEYNEFNKLTLGHSFKNTETTLNNFEWFEEPIVMKKNQQTKKAKSEKKVKSIKMNKQMELIHDEEAIEIKLDEKLKSIGKDVFIKIYPVLFESLDAKIEDIVSIYPKYSEFTTGSQSSRLSKSKSIFKAGLQLEALQSIVDSSRLEESVRSKAQLYLDGK